MTTNNATPREALINALDTADPTGFSDYPETADAVIAHLWDQVDSYDFFDALETWVNSNDDYEPEDIAGFTAGYLLGPRPSPSEQEAER